MCNPMLIAFGPLLFYIFQIKLIMQDLVTRKHWNVQKGCLFLSSPFEDDTLQLQLGWHFKILSWFSSFLLANSFPVVLNTFIYIIKWLPRGCGGWYCTAMIVCALGVNTTGVPVLPSEFHKHKRYGNRNFPSNKPSPSHITNRTVVNVFTELLAPFLHAWLGLLHK